MPASQHLVESSLGALLCSRLVCRLLFAELLTEMSPNTLPTQSCHGPRIKPVCVCVAGPRSWAHCLSHLSRPLHANTAQERLLNCQNAGLWKIQSPESTSQIGICLHFRFPGAGLAGVERTVPSGSPAQPGAHVPALRAARQRAGLGYERGAGHGLSLLQHDPCTAWPGCHRGPGQKGLPSLLLPAWLSTPS